MSKMTTRLTGREAREIMHIACKGDGIIPGDKLSAAHILAERGYLSITDLGDGRYLLEVSQLARAISRNLTGWFRYPPLNPADLLRRRKRVSAGSVTIVP